MHFTKIKSYIHRLAFKLPSSLNLRLTLKIKNWCLGSTKKLLPTPRLGWLFLLFVRKFRKILDISYNVMCDWDQNKILLNPKIILKNGLEKNRPCGANWEPLPPIQSIMCACNIERLNSFSREHATAKSVTVMCFNSQIEGVGERGLWAGLWGGLQFPSKYFF